MLTNRSITPILPVLDLERARDFYGAKLGLHPGEGPFTEGSLIFDAGNGTKLEIEQRTEPTKAEHTALTFEVDDIEHEVEELEGRGIRFEDYDLPGLKTEGHIARIDRVHAAWFKDPDGNILCIHQMRS